MPRNDALNSHRMRRRIWFLWAPTISLLVVFGALLFLYFRVNRLLDGGKSLSMGSWDEWIPSVAFVATTFLFILYSILKQSELNRLREALLTEETEAMTARARFGELVDLFQLASILNVSISAERMLEIIVRRAVGCLRAQQASIMLLGDDEQTLETRASYGVEGEYAWSGRQKLGEGIAGWVVKNKKPLLLNRGDDHPVLKINFKPHRNISSAVCVPILSEGRAIGVLNVNRINHPDPLSEEQLEIVRLFAEHVGAVIERARRMEELGRRARSLEETNAQLVEFNRMKDAFLSTASHELKTPLTSVIGYAELLSDHFQKIPEESQHEFLHRLRGEAGRLMHLIEDVMDLSRLETGKSRIQVEEVSLNDLARAAVQTVLGACRARAPVIVEEYAVDLESIRLDEGKIRQVVVNLLSNAVRFSPDGSEIRIRTERDGDGIRLGVTDSGPGVAPQDRERIFALFGQGDQSSAKDAGGLGIGLHLVKRIVELHHGSVGVETASTGGSTFWFRLPFNAAIEAEAA